MSFERRYIVQDRGSKQFLGTDDEGEMDYFEYVSSAHLFESEESAALTGFAMCDSGGFLIFPLFIEY
jgi:hypothetical protein